MSCGVGCRRGSDPALLWLWCRLAAIALIRPLAWELQYAVGAALEMAKRQEKKKKNDQRMNLCTKKERMLAHCGLETHSEGYQGTDAVHYPVRTGN